MLDIIFEILSIFISGTSKVNEQAIAKNIKVLKRYPWFEDLLKEQRNRDKIIFNKKIRNIIGRCKTNKLNNDRYQVKFQYRLLRALK
ncbi:hypothetical protein Pryu01_02403 [Paraliobacillus ryukyuensis]|uniref:Uncharacterized protein n=1 Tax=Paraliobacillus ryukyuensis TaxID=200904 RepID=A0A366DYL5_9BACI|nr:hypothetical protein [Paraliobacillus ryukyuensis]RBO94619.1 hypothetical protein DES48_110106 [Paraliobacillus ryukyuensis]